MYTVYTHIKTKAHHHLINLGGKFWCVFLVFYLYIISTSQLGIIIFFFNDSFSHLESSTLDLTLYSSTLVSFKYNKNHIGNYQPSKILLHLPGNFQYAMDTIQYVYNTNHEHLFNVWKDIFS